ncbi:Phenylacetate 2-hydroxylase [Lachnellula occidentalis]|uniref:Phenylacetate 2-hydroxylase n=1 Tax=Lachnellula occidentalis TaxID=215460 RepID=A0A8H8S568_9HELO|nr:Phenylacetate 2-hydroxylase [Lachnellula occidentalis]
MDVTFLISNSTVLVLSGLFLITTAAVYVYLYFFYVDIPKIDGIPEIPGGEILAGHLYTLGNDHATTAEAWAFKYGWPVFQLRMGRRRAIMLNSFEAARDWMVKNQAATLDRPWFHTFHGVISATSAATIGTSPWDERTKKQRRVVGSFTTGPSIQKLRKVLHMETCAVISSLYYDSQKGRTDIMPHIYQERLALNLMMMFCYGTRFSSVEDPLLVQILKDASTIASFRSTSSNAQDFIPHLRYIGGNERTATAKEVRGRRDQWLAKMLDNVRDSLNLHAGPKKSVAEMLLADSSKDDLTASRCHQSINSLVIKILIFKVDVKTILGGLMSGGFETIYSTAIITIGMLSTLQGQSMQQEAYEDIMKVYDTPADAFNLCLTEEKSPYVMGLVKEALRFFPPLKLLPARQTFTEFVYQGATIPKGVLVYMNTQAINRGMFLLADQNLDKETYGPDAEQFRPNRWLGKDHGIPPPYHFAFGAGGRMCTAVNFSNRVLYALFLRLIISFKMTESKLSPPNTDYINYKRDSTESTSIASEFKVNFTPRDTAVLEQCLEQAQDELTDLLPGVAAEPLIR